MNGYAIGFAIGFLAALVCFYDPMARYREEFIQSEIRRLRALRDWWQNYATQLFHAAEERENNADWWKK